MPKVVNKTEFNLRAKGLENISNVWENYQKGKALGDGQFYRNQLIEHYLHVVKYTASRLIVHLCPNVEWDDLVSSGVFGLMDAIENFDSSRKVKFETHAYSRIKGEMIDYLRSTDFVPIITRYRNNQIENAKDNLKVRFGREPLSEELRLELGMDEKEYKLTIKDAGNILHMLNSLEDDRDDFKRKEGYFESVEDKKTVSPTKKLDLKFIKEYFLKGLNRKEQCVLVLYYYENLTMNEIAKIIEVNESRVCQMHKGLLGRLKDKLDKDSLEQIV